MNLFGDMMVVTVFSSVGRSFAYFFLFFVIVILLFCNYVVVFVLNSNCIFLDFLLLVWDFFCVLVNVCVKFLLLSVKLFFSVISFVRLFGKLYDFYNKNVFGLEIIVLFFCLVVVRILLNWLIFFWSVRSNDFFSSAMILVMCVCLATSFGNIVLSCWIKYGMSLWKKFCFVLSFLCLKWIVWWRMWCNM